MVVLLRLLLELMALGWLVSWPARTFLESDCARVRRLHHTCSEGNSTNIVEVVLGYEREDL